MPMLGLMELVIIMGMLFLGLLGLAAIIVGIIIWARGDRSVGGKRVPCPHCGEHIRPEASICRYCGRDVTPVQPEILRDPPLRPE